MAEKAKKETKKPNDWITVRGARTHNLKNVTVSIPRGSMTAITGLSGSGKSSLAFDTIFAEGQRRYVESLSAYARQFLSQMPKPEVDEITGLSPAISIDQKSRSNNPRSTVATITEIYDYLRVLYARIGRPYSPISGEPIRKLTTDEIIALVESKIETVRESTNVKTNILGVSWNEYRVQLYAPVVRGRKGEYYQMLYDYLGKGFSHVRVDGVVHNLREKIVMTKTKAHDIDLLIDEFALHEATVSGFRLRLSESVERALFESDGLLRIVVGGTSVYETQSPTLKTPEDILVSAKLISPTDGYSFPEIEPRMFSFNSPYGACTVCKGLGVKHLFGNENDKICESCFGSRLRVEAGFVLIGSEQQSVSLRPKLRESRTSTPELYRTQEYTEGKRTVSLKARKTGWKTPGLNIFEFGQLSIADAHDFILELELTAKEEEIAGILLNEIESRLQFLLNVGLEYLSLDRRANTLSGGESQRIRLASQLGSKLVGALYVLDEPTIGLHQRDNDRLISTLTELRDIGNTIIIVEHDEDTVRAADYIIDIGPGAGRHGGQVMAQGYLTDFLNAPKLLTPSLTLEYLRGDKIIPVPNTRRTRDKGKLSVVGAQLNNIHNLSIDIPLGRVVAVSGVSGSGKSTFLYEILYRNLLAKYDRQYRSAQSYHCAQFTGDTGVSRVVMVDQSPIGRTPRSNPATYTGAWSHIRDLFATTTDAKIRGWGPSRFSFNVKGGRCEACQGRGEVMIEMHFLPTVYVTCDICAGKRFDKETLGVRYKGKNVSEILDMSVEDAAEFFNDIAAITDRLSIMNDVGLSYVKLGQPSSELSGGESQRVKIASELYRPMTEKTIYLLDEPTVGLHFEDVRKLIEIINRLVERGNSVVLIEHNLDILKSADYIIDFGPEGGVNGGSVIATGTPEEVANNPKSHTGKYLAHILTVTHKRAKK